MKFLRVVLVSPKYPRNVGMVSRIMTNYGIDKLILVSPRCKLDKTARQGAAQGQQPLQDATLYNSWSEFTAGEPEGLRIAFSRRQGRRRASEALPHLLVDEVIQPDRPTYLFFGAEDHGLSADDLELAHRLAYFDLPGPLQSMNLSHSVLLAVESFYRKFGATDPVEESSEPIRDPEPMLRLWLKTLQFDLESQTRWNMLTFLKQFIMRASPSNQDLDKFESLIQQSVRKIKQ